MHCGCADHADQNLQAEHTASPQELEKQPQGLLRNIPRSDTMSEYKDWKTKKVTNLMYNVTGTGLGWSSGQLVDGTWTYYQDREAIQFTCAESKALYQVLALK